MPNRRFMKMLIIILVFRVFSASTGMSAVTEKSTADPAHTAQRMPEHTIEAQIPADTASAGIGDDVPDLMHMGLRMSGALIVVLGLFFMGVYGVKRMMNGKGNRIGKESMIRVIATRYMGSRNTLSVIDVQGERFVVGISSQGITLMTRLHCPSEADGQSHEGSSFQHVLEGKMHGR